MSSPTFICSGDVGLLTNHRISLEIAAGIAALTGRSLDVRRRGLGGAPERILESEHHGSILDLLVVPEWITERSTDWQPASGAPVKLDWDDLPNCVWTDGGFDEATLESFALGRSVLDGFGAFSDEPAVEFEGRLLSFPSFFFAVSGESRRVLDETLRSIGPLPEIVAFSDSMAAWLGDFQAAHIRRSDLLKGLPAYQRVTAEEVAKNLRSVLSRTDPLVICSDTAGDDAFFDPIRREFTEVVFLNELILGIGTWRERFLDLPIHDENALGLVTQEVAARAEAFVGTIGSTFTGAIHRERVRRDPAAPFWFTADYTPSGPVFDRCSFVERHEGPFTWNRIGYGMDARTLAWFRSWPEANFQFMP